MIHIALLGSRAQGCCACHLIHACDERFSSTLISIVLHFLISTFILYLLHFFHFLEGRSEPVHSAEKGMDSLDETYSLTGLSHSLFGNGATTERDPSTSFEKDLQGLPSIVHIFSPFFAHINPSLVSWRSASPTRSVLLVLNHIVLLKFPITATAETSRDPGLSSRSLLITLPRLKHTHLHTCLRHREHVLSTRIASPASHGSDFSWDCRRVLHQIPPNEIDQHGPTGLGLHPSRCIQPSKCFNATISDQHVLTIHGFCVPAMVS